MLPPRVARAAAATRSGLRRYPRQIIESLRDHVGQPIDAPRTAASRLDLAAFAQRRLSAVWIGHATVLLRIGGMTVLTDPVFSSRIGMSVGGVTVGIARLLPPALEIEHLPHIDLVLLSHAHFDHLDKPSLRRLAAPGAPAHGATVITADRTRALIPPGFGEVIQLAWGRQTRVSKSGGDLRVHAFEPRHWGARTAYDRHRRYNAYLLESGSGAHGRVLFAGDTAHTDTFDRLPSVGLSIFGIGAYESWDGAHATPEQVWSMFTRGGGGGGGGGDGGHLLPMHHSTFDMGEKHPEEPITRLIAAAGDRAHKVICRAVGEAWEPGS
jgi:L-ascorbate metabolism protein UlaG (beta-lactamase superfamily)